MTRPATAPAASSLQIAHGTFKRALGGFWPKWTPSSLPTLDAKRAFWLIVLSEHGSIMIEEALQQNPVASCSVAHPTRGEWHPQFPECFVTSRRNRF
jgi:hypothetical protein